ncbi:MAG: ATP synthase F1 subunit gamma [Nitrospira sp.]|uniref:ATP synthase gamma chain n=1 Tax=Nitrospira defluvii TaxID=330214 RepID=A0ABM8QMQ0_9BACT|nr:ATP synthase F1 subunit gamma [Nitrospira defluvii]MCS6325851.1 ATP synthase F1 subunit gamma [Nitrospira sp.]CAE6705294.1 ATP synthase gamma chain [Nitrospira defluvii]
MPSLQSLRRKIAAFKNTQKITKAMKMVAAAKLKRSQDRILAARPYAHKMRGVLSNLSQRVNRTSHPLLQKREGKKIEILVVTSDRGLCGGFNGNIVRKSAEFVRQCESQGLSVNLSLIGRKGRDYFRRRSWPIRQEWTGIFDKLSFEHAIDIGGDLTENFIKGTFDELYVVYNEFKSAIQQRVIVEKLFPIDAAAEFGAPQATEGSSLGGSYLYEPDEGELLSALVPKHFQIQTYRILLESAAAEHGARMAAMDGATRNAGQLIKKVTLYYNKTRQAAITKELMDIVGGAEALK